MADLTKVKTRELGIGDDWKAMVRVRGLDMTDAHWSAQLRPYLESKVVLATPQVEVTMDGDDTVVFFTIPDTVTSTLNPGRAVWGVKAGTSLFWGDLNLVDRPVR